MTGYLTLAQSQAEMGALHRGNGTRWGSPEKLEAFPRQLEALDTELIRSVQARERVFVQCGALRGAGAGSCARYCWSWWVPDQYQVFPFLPTISHLVVKRHVRIDLSEIVLEAPDRWAIRLQPCRIPGLLSGPHPGRRMGRDPLALSRIARWIPG